MQGLKNKEIATVLCVSENTVKVYLCRLFQKVGVKDRFELALYGLRNVSAGPRHLEQPAHHSQGTQNVLGAPEVPSLHSQLLDGLQKPLSDVWLAPAAPLLT